MVEGQKKTVFVSTSTTENGDGSETSPFASLVHALRATMEEDVDIMVDGEPAAKSAVKKAKKLAASEIKKEEAAKKAAEADAAKQKETAQLKIEEDKSLPTAVITKIGACKDHLGKRVRVFGWVHRMRQQGKNLLFLILRDGTGYVQCILTGKLCKTEDAINLHREASVMVVGGLKSVPEGNDAPMGVEIAADFWEVVGRSPPEIESIVTPDSSVDTLMEHRHIVHRGTHGSLLLKLRSMVTHAFRESLFADGYTEVTPPSLVQTQVEGGSTLFKLDYFGQEAFLTQSSQLYLETVCPAVGNCFCIMSSFRAEKSRTRRHLAEYTHLEAELPFITFDDLLDGIESLVHGVVSRALASPLAKELKELNPKLEVPKRPFKRMDYTDALAFLKEHNIYKNEETKEYYEFGDDIPEAPERKMIDMIGEPVFLCRFPTEQKPFYMQRVEGDERLTESCDLLVPGVGEIVGGSMRVWKESELLEGFQREGISPENYYWYVDQRKYGGCPHGGYGLGVDRFLTWIFAEDHIRTVCLYPRYLDHCKP